MSLKITFIGAGNMASSLVGGLIAKGFDPQAITMADVNEQQLQQVRSTYGVATERDNLLACSKADVVMLAVKPQVIEAVVSPLRATVSERAALVISVAAGIPVRRLQDWLGDNTAIVRCMPNTPALVQLGATGLFANPHVSAQQRDLARQILASVGLALWLDHEDQIDAVTALSGSGPAYFFLVMEAMMAAGRSLGLADNVSRQLTLQTALGAAHMAITGDVDPAELRRRVTSPGGTTERALSIFEAGDLRGLFERALTGAYDRSKELAGK
jgi:pyrroline-5-carboxylate reductase